MALLITQARRPPSQRLKPRRHHRRAFNPLRTRQAGQSVAAKRHDRKRRCAPRNFILHNLSLLLERSFASVQELNRYRKEVTAKLAAAAAAAAGSVVPAAPGVKPA